jgi:predicted transcriptional regulator
VITDPLQQTFNCPASSQSLGVGAIFLAIKTKRDRIEILAEILGACRSPQSQTYIRRQTNISYTVLQSCIVYLLLRNWLSEIEVTVGQKKLEITDKGLTFLAKWLELQRLAGLKNKNISIAPLVKVQSFKASKGL